MYSIHYILDSTCTGICQFCRPYSTVQPAKFIVHVFLTLVRVPLPFPIDEALLGGGGGGGIGCPLSEFQTL